MRITVDTNVLLDVFQNREPHYTASARVLTLVQDEAVEGVFPAHALTTLYYLVSKYGTRPDAEAAMDKVLDHFQIGNLDTSGWQRARAQILKMPWWRQWQKRPDQALSLREMSMILRIRQLAQLLRLSS